MRGQCMASEWESQTGECRLDIDRVRITEVRGTATGSVDPEAWNRGTAVSPMKTRATVGTDGVVRIELTVGQELAGHEVEVTVEATQGARREKSSVQYPPGWRKMTQEEWIQRVKSTAGSIKDPTFVRPPALPLQDRGPIFD